MLIDSPAASCLILVAASAGAWAASYLLGGSRTAGPHMFYIPILLAGFRFGPLGGAVVAIACGVVAGPLLPLDTDLGIAQEHPNWLIRLGFFLAIGTFTGILASRLRAHWARQAALLEREARLVAHKAAIIQSVSHEFRTPLTVITGVAETLREKGLVETSGHPLLDGMLRAVRRLDSLTDTVLVTAGLLEDRRALSESLVDLRELIEEVVSSLGPRAADRVVYSGVEGVDVTTNRDLLSQTLRCLVDNALKFSPENEPVEVVATRVPDGVSVVVRDRGPGIPAGFAPAARELFTQRDTSAQTPYGGLGLGLYIATQASEQLGAQLRFQAGPSEGTDACLFLPQRRHRS